MIYLYLFICLFIIKSTHQNDPSNSLFILSMTPNDDNEIYQLNEQYTFGSGYYHGWILPSDVKIQLNFQLYSNETIYFANSSLLKDHNIKSINTIYMYFTTEDHNCNNYHQEQHIPLNFVTHDDNIYTANIQTRLEYSKLPYFICLQQLHNPLVSQIRQFSHQGTNYWLSIITTKDDMPLWSRIVIFVVLLTLSGLFSGLNLGLMSLDLSELEILKKIGTQNERSYAKKIYPLRKQGNFLLCTILLGNVLVNSVSTLILGDLLSGIYAAFGSTILIVLFGEIIPQAACSKHGLAVGAHTRFITYTFMALTSPISYPLGKILDKILGKEIAATYNREKIRELMKNVKDLEAKELKMISGALDFTNRIVKDIMTPLRDVYMLDINSRLDFSTIAEITQKGFSRIPVYDTTRDNVIGLLHVKDFTLLDPDDNMPVKALLEFYNHKVTYCYMDDKLDQMFEKFRQGETHLAFVIQTVQDEDKDPYLECVGIITLEDIIEELVQFEIYDEFDDKKDIEDEMKLNETTKLLIYNPNKSKSKESNLNEKRKNNRFSTCSSKSTNSNASSTINNEENYNKNTNKLEMNHVNSAEKQQNTKNTNGAVTNPSATNRVIQHQASHELAFFIQQQKEDSNQSALISPQLRLASFQFLSSSVIPFTNEFFTKNVLELIFKKDVFKESVYVEKSGNPPEYLYQYGKSCNYFILILTGEATVEVGREKLEFIVGQFSYFGVNALLNDCETADEVLQDTDIRPRYKQYVPDFSLRVDTKCVYFKLDRFLWRNGVRKSKYEMLNNNTNYDALLNGTEHNSDYLSINNIDHIKIESQTSLSSDGAVSTAINLSGNSDTNNNNNNSLNRSKVNSLSLDNNNDMAFFKTRTNLRKNNKKHNNKSESDNNGSDCVELSTLNNSTDVTNF